MATIHFHSVRHSAALVVALGCACIADASKATAAEPDSPAATAPVTVEGQVQSWIDQLDSDQYVVRERAMQSLRGIGAAALPQLAKAADGSSFERASACVRLLLELSESDDTALSLDALQKIASLKNRPTERATAAAILGAMREKWAMAEIRRLGAVEQMQHVDDGQVVVTQLKIGEEWTGGDDGLKYLKELPSLQSLMIHGAPITDKGAEHLRQLKNISIIQLYGTEISEEGVAELRRALARKDPPQVDIHVRRGAFLGVGGLPNAQGAQVNEVRPDSAAQEAGIMVGDIITKFDGQPVKDFEALTGFIAKCKGGDKAKLEFVRGEETITREVTFKKWR